jgi:pyruvate/2-oxoglutarate dehydrogenase complex dihydrolipoamide dehydrogenase (E3) component
VLGSGEAGKYIAWTLAKKGMRAVVIERKYVGGSCPNIACLPSKNIIHSAKIASYFWRSGEFGIPGHLLIIGGGYIGLELAQAMRRFGSRVTIIDRNARLAHREDRDVTDMLHDMCREEGIEVVTSARITKVEGKSVEWVKLYLVIVPIDGSKQPKPMQFQLE